MTDPIEVGPAPGAPPARRRRRLSLSLRTLMILVVVVAVPMGWKASRVSVQKRAVARIKALQGRVTYDWNWDRNLRTFSTAEGPSAPLWLRRFLGDEYFQEIAAVDFSMPHINDLEILGDRDDDDSAVAYNPYEDSFIMDLQEDQLACLDGLDRVESLDFHDHYRIKPEGFARLEQFETSLKTLRLTGNFPADNSSRLARFTNLEELRISVGNDWLNGFPVPTLDWAFLDKLHRLRNLSLVGLPLTDDALRGSGTCDISRICFSSAPED